MNALITFGLIMMTLLPVRGEDWHAIYKNTNKPWMERWGYLSAHAQSMPPEIRFEILSHLLGNDDNPNYNEAQKDIARNITRVLLDTPGHAEYFGKQLEALPQHPDRRYWYQYLANLPSPETVGVLGELLADDSERPELAEDESNAERYLSANPNCDRAVAALTELLDNPPSTSPGGYMFNRDLETWRLWWERVKAGKQTFRFKGDPQNYDLNGPVAKASRDPGEKRPERRLTGGEKPHAEEGSETAKPEAEDSASNILPYLVALGMLLAGLCFWHFRRNTSAS